MVRGHAGAWLCLAPHIIDAADHGVPQHRDRLFIIATRSRNPLQLDLPKRPHVPASQIIDFNCGQWSDIERPGRSARTLARVHNGRQRFGERFVMPYYGNGSGKTGRSLARPLGTITTRARWAVVNGERMRMLLPDEGRAAMGFRPGYQLPPSQELAWHLLGNAVAPPVAADVISALQMAA